MGEAPKPASKVSYLSEKFPQHSIGKGSYGSLSIKNWGEKAKLTIGSYCSIADGVTILLGGEHRSDWVTTYPFNVLWEQCVATSGHPVTKGDVTIEHDVWIGTDAMILSGVTIGSGAIIGARAVVTRNVPPYAIVAGNPARTIRKRFDDKTIDLLLAIAWWNWNEERIRKALPLLQSDRIQDFISAASEGEL